jgi:hypothetical protein
MTGIDEQRHQPPTDSTRGTGEKNIHADNVSLSVCHSRGGAYWQPCEIGDDRRCASRSAEQLKASIESVDPAVVRSPDLKIRSLQDRHGHHVPPPSAKQKTVSGPCDALGGGGGGAHK